MEVFRAEDVAPDEPWPGVKIRWVIDRRRGAQNFAMRIFEIAAGGATPMHEHWYEQEMYLLEGRGALVGEQGEVPLAPGQILWIQPQERHQLRNTGPGTLKIICCIPITKALASAATIP
jgi:quercetin dioxygenase-like cupin family protein